MTPKLVVVLLLTVAAAHAQTLQFSGYEWQIKSSPSFGPGPNAWSSSNVFLDDAGRLHLKISKIDGQWTCAEVQTTKRLGFGTYEFQVIGPVDHLDKNIVLGLFNYPPADVGPDGTNEIDIEFAQWGDAKNKNANFSVWPPKQGAEHGSHTFDLKLAAPESTHRFTWTSQSIVFQSLQTTELATFTFAPKAPADQIPQHPLPAYINLWLFRGLAPTDGKDVELIIKSFSFTPLKI